MAFLSVFGYLVSAWLVFCAWKNIAFFKKVPPADPGRRKWPRVSILIPARNEERRIQPLLENLLHQEYPDYEILVLDDCSTDRTLDLLLACAKKHKALRVIPGRMLPPGWLGKPWACQQLSENARGDWFLYTDADTRHEPEMLKRSVQFAEREKADALSLMNEQITESWMEKLVVPVMVFSLVAYLPGAWALNPKSPLRRFAGVGGQFILIRQGVYRALGGHAAVKNEIVEDLRFGMELVGRGYRVVLGNGSEFTSCRMYENAKEVWEGFSKNMFPASGFSFIRMAAVILVLVGLGAAPFFSLFGGFSSPIFFPCLALALSQWFIRLAHAYFFRMSKLSVAFHPLGSVLFSLIGINSTLWFRFGLGRWKGRTLQIPKRAKS
jgi:chlorobactene glucosyltransferase